MPVPGSLADQYRDQGYVLLPECFSHAEVDVLRNEAAALVASESPARIMEDNQAAVRSVYGAHQTNDVFRRLCGHPRLVTAVSELMQDEVYVYQFKINAKSAFVGDVWEWHQDYIFWAKQDGMPQPLPVTAAVYLDDVTDINGPMLVIPRSHHAGMIDASDAMAARTGDPAWMSSLTARLRFSLNTASVSRLAEQHGIVTTTAPRGSVLFFHSNLVHASGANMSPYSRTIALVTYNGVSNVPVPSGERRPEFLVSRDTTPITPLADDALSSLHVQTLASQH